jgi:hypothetical protein
MIERMFYAGALLELVGLGLTWFFGLRWFRRLQSFKHSDALTAWRRAPTETREGIRAAWRRGSPVEPPDEAQIAVAMSDHVDRVLEATNRVTWWACVPAIPGLALILASFSHALWLLVLVPPAVWLAGYPFTARSRRRRRRSVELTRLRLG